MKKMFLIALALFLTAGVLPAQETAPAKAEKMVVIWWESSLMGREN